MCTAVNRCVMCGSTAVTYVHCCVMCGNTGGKALGPELLATGALGITNPPEETLLQSLVFMNHSHVYLKI